MFDDLNSQQNNQKQQTPQTPEPPASNTVNVQAKNNEPEDIFAGTDKMAAAKPKPPQFQPRQAGGPNVPSAVAQPAAGSNLSALAQNPAQSSSGGGQNKKYIVIGAIAIAALILILISMIALAYFKAQDPSPSGGANLSVPNNGLNGNDNTGDVMESDAGDNMEENSEDGDAMTDGDVMADTSENGDVMENTDNEPNTVILDEITDSDSDGLTDGEEKRLGTNIASSDTDNDGLFDRQEVRIYQTDPTNSDTDGDGYTDGEEVDNGYNPKGEGKLYELP